MRTYFDRVAHLPVRPTSAGPRLLARFIDGLILVVIAALGAVLSRFLPGDLWDWLRGGWGARLLYFAYEAGFLLAWRATPGKRALGLIVANRTTGGPAPAWSIVVRSAVITLAPRVPYVGTVVGLAVVLPILWNGFGLHDYAGATVVTDDDPTQPPR